MERAVPCTPTRLGLRPYELASFETLCRPAFVVLVAATLLRLAAFRIVLQPLSIASLGPDSKNLRKLQEAAWRCVLYTVACAWAIKLVVFGKQLEWVGDSELFWKGWPNHETTADMKSLYALYLGLYVHQLIFLFVDTRSSDFIALIVHHLITLTIVVASWSIGFTRVGTFTMVLHDCSDVFLEHAKCLNYVKEATSPAAQSRLLALGPDVAFAVFAITFFALRLYVFPSRVLYSAAIQSCDHVVCVPFDCTSTGVYQIFLSCLAGLQLLQVFWGWKILGVVARVLRGKPLEDPREEGGDGRGEQEPKKVR